MGICSAQIALGALVAVGFEWILKGGPTAEGTKAAQGEPKSD